MTNTRLQFCLTCNRQRHDCVCSKRSDLSQEAVREQGWKNDLGKFPMGLLPRYGLEQVAAVLGHGAEKYSRHNWRQGIAVQRNIDAALRHIFAANEGADTDPESGLPHFAHAICDLMFVLNTIHDRPEFDDRWKPDALP